MSKEIKTVQHVFMPGHTIVAAIRAHNGYDLSANELDYLLQQFILLNGTAVLKAGQSTLIPILKRDEA